MKKRFSIIGIVFISSLIIFMTGCPTSPEDEKKDDNNTTTEAVLDSIYISKEPNKTNYEYNATLDLTGLEVKARYSDKTEKVITEWTSNPKNRTKLTTSGTVNVLIYYQNKTANFRIRVLEKPVITADQYFWGTWQRMDNGQTYIIEEKDVFLFEDEKATNTYKIISSSQNELTVSTLGTFKKQSDAVMINGAIPYFRKGGSNLSYTMKLVGFEDTVATNNENTIAGRAARTDYIIKAKSKNYPSYTQETQADENGSFTLNAPVAGDEQIISVDTEDGIVIVSGIRIDNDGANLGTIPLSKTGQYSLKVTGTIDECEKAEGYLYGNNYKQYPLTLTITNISEVTSAPSVCTITPADPRLIVTATDGSDIIGGVLISTLKKGFTKTISLSVECGSITEGYIDTGLIVNVKNAATGRIWQDYVPLRFYGGLVPITIAGESIESNPDAALNGFVVYPDGNSQFFSVPQGSNKIIYVPSFKSDKHFILAFSGATVQGTLSDSTEMLYTVALGSSRKKSIDMTGDAFSPSVRFGEEGNKNEIEETAFDVTEDFQAYLADGEIDYFKFGIVYEEIVNPSVVKPKVGWEFTRPNLTTSLIIQPTGTNGTAGTGAKYVLFGDWPQTIKSNNVTVDERISEVHGAFTYYSGSDGYWYVKCKENAWDSSYKYSNRTPVAQSSENSTKYFKVEPIKWCVLTEDYNGTGKALLLAENILTGNVPYYVSLNSRIINSSIVDPNNYKYSTIRAYLNGAYEKNDTQINIYANKGFLQTAFTIEAQSLIATTIVYNSEESTTDSGNYIKQATSYACENTNDKIFLLSEKEVTMSSLGFPSYSSYGTESARIRVTTDFAKANYAYQNTSSDYGGCWWLRSPSFNKSYYARGVTDVGYANYDRYDGVISTDMGVVPALTISLE